MPAIEFEDFYQKIYAFGVPFVEAAKGNPDALAEEVNVNPERSVRIVGRSISTKLAREAIAAILWFRPSSEYLNYQFKMANLKSLDCVIAVRMHEVAPLTMARKMGPEIVKREFADYALSLGLPHIAKAIEAGVKTSLFPRSEPC